MQTTFPQTVLIVILFILLCARIFSLLRKGVPFLLNCLLTFAAIIAIIFLLIFLFKSA